MTVEATAAVERPPSTATAEEWRTRLKLWSLNNLAILGLVAKTDLEYDKRAGDIDDIRTRSISSSERYLRPYAKWLRGIMGGTQSGNGASRTLTSLASDGASPRSLSSAVSDTINREIERCNEGIWFAAAFASEIPVARIWAIGQALDLSLKAITQGLERRANPEDSVPMTTVGAAVVSAWTANVLDVVGPSLLAAVDAVIEESDECREEAESYLAWLPQPSDSTIRRFYRLSSFGHSCSLE